MIEQAGVSSVLTPAIPSKPTDSLLITTHHSTQPILLSYNTLVATTSAPALRPKRALQRELGTEVSPPHVSQPTLLSPSLMLSVIVLFPINVIKQ